MGEVIRVVLADDQEMVRNGLAMMLGSVDDIEVVGAVGDGRQAVELARQLRPDVCLLDVRMPVLDGISACAELRKDPTTTDVDVVIVTTFDEDEVVDGALAAGAVGFLLKSASAALVIEAVRAAAAGDQLVAPEVTGPLLRRMAERTIGPSTEVVDGPIVALSDREEEVLVEVAQGHTNAEIADHLHVSLATVKTHVNSLLTKLGARNRVELAAFAFRSRRTT